MPQSKKRDSQKHHHIDYIPHRKKKGSAKPVTIIFCSLLSVAIAWFAADDSWIWLPIGGLIGAIFGYFLGSRINDSIK